MDSASCPRPSGSRHSLPILRRVKATPISSIIDASSQVLGGSSIVQRPTRARLTAVQPEGDPQKERKHVHRQKSEKDLTPIARHAIPSVEDVTKKQRGFDSSQAPALPTPPLKQSTPPKSSAIDELGTVSLTSFLKVKAELDATKKIAHEYKRYMRKQEKQIEQMKEEIERLQKLQLESDASAQKTSRKTEELVTAIEASVQCQICMETLINPFYLKCGHIYCLVCLQQWFRNMPRRDNGDDSDSEGLEGDEYIMAHPKSCPTCRTAVHDRPAPVFVIKSVIGALEAYRGTPGSQTGEPSSEDPWLGIFYPPGEPAANRSRGNRIRDLLQFRLAFSDEEDQYEEAAEGFDEDDDRDTWASSVFGGYGSEEEFFDPVEEEYVLARYEPPRLNLVPYEMLYDEELDMLNRGCTMEMMQKYHMSYSDETGLLAIVHGGTQIYLGWNITLEPDDADGSALLNSIVAEVLNGSPKWEVTSWSGEDSGFIARRRVLVSELDRYRDSPYPAGDDSDDDPAPVRVHEIIPIPRG